MTDRDAEEKQDVPFPWNDHMRYTIEPYIQWREKEAVRNAYLEFAQMYLQGKEKNAGIS